MATGALRGLIDAILVVPGKRRGEMTIWLRDDLAALLHGGGEPEGGTDVQANGITAVLRVGNGRFGGVLGTLDAGTRNHLDLLLTG